MLDQGYWPETGLTAPDDEALRRDVELAKAMGFNGVRKHQKIEDPRYLYWADRLGSWCGRRCPAPIDSRASSVERRHARMDRGVDRDYSHPCIVAWVPFNESWGVPNLPDSPHERHYVQALYHLTKTLDRHGRSSATTAGKASPPTSSASTTTTRDPIALRAAITPTKCCRVLFRRERPGGRLLVLGEGAPAEQPIILSEFGGISSTDTFVLDWRTLPAWVLPTGTLAALVSTALSIYATGGFDSPVEQVPVFVVVYSACFLSSRFTLLCVVGAVAVHELPLVYDAHARARASERTRSARSSSSARWPSSWSSGACCSRASPRSTP